jgi:hypothetical protein
MATFDDLRALALELPETTEKPAWGNPTYRVAGQMFVWERPLRAKELSELGGDAPEGPIAGARVEDLGEKEALLDSDPDTFFTVMHFDGHPSVLVRLDAVDVSRLREIVLDAWLARAPAALAKDHLSR